MNNKELKKIIPSPYIPKNKKLLAGDYIVINNNKYNKIKNLNKEKFIKEVKKLKSVLKKG